MLKSLPQKLGKMEREDFIKSSCSPVWILPSLAFPSLGSQSWAVSVSVQVVHCGRVWTWPGASLCVDGDGSGDPSSSWHKRVRGHRSDTGLARLLVPASAPGPGGTDPCVEQFNRRDGLFVIVGLARGKTAPVGRCTEYRAELLRLGRGWGTASYLWPTSSTRGLSVEEGACPSSGAAPPAAPCRAHGALSKLLSECTCSSRSWRPRSCPTCRCCPSSGKACAGSPGSRKVRRFLPGAFHPRTLGAWAAPGPAGASGT